MGQPHKHAEIIKAWADGAEIEYFCFGGEWLPCLNTPYWNEDAQYRIKPEPPKYPQTMMTDSELLIAFEHCGAANIDRARFIANAAIAQAIEDGQVVAPGPWLEQTPEGFIQFGKEYVPAAMLEKVAEAVRVELVAQVARYSTGCSTYINGEIDLASIVKRVKEAK